MFSGNSSLLIWISYLFIDYWGVIVVVVLLLFGSKKLPEIARGIGQSLGEFKGARDEFEREIHNTEAEIRRIDKEKGSDQKTDSGHRDQ